MKNKFNRFNTIKKRIARQKELFLKQFKKNTGNVSISCVAIGIDRGTYYNWRKTDKEFARKADEAIFSIHEKVEDQLLKNIFAGKESSLFFYLCNRMPERWKSIQKIEQRFASGTEAKIDQLLSSLAEELKNGSR